MQQIWLKAAIAASLMLPGGLFAANAHPLGFELGIATYAQVNAEAGAKTPLADAGINPYSGGRMLSGDGSGLDFDGLSEVVFIFDPADKLAGVLMTLPKQDSLSDLENLRFQKVLSDLSKEYELVDQQLPFVGNAYAKLRQGDSIIELDAPHLSFTMALRYLTDRLEAAIPRQTPIDGSNR